MRISFLVAVLVVASFGCNRGAEFNVVLRVVAEMPGAHCSSGGLAVQTGFDKNANGALDDDEVNADATKFVCNGTNGTNGMNGVDGSQGDAGTPGVNALSQVTAEPAGTNCRYGGSRVDVGADLDADGTLDTNEITSTHYICDRASIDAVYFGDLTLRDADDLALLDGIQVVAGDLTIESVPNGQFTSPTLRIISGSLQIGSFCCIGGSIGEAPVPLTSVSLPELTQMGSLYVSYASDLTSITLPKLQRAGNIDMSAAAALTTFSVPALKRVDDLRIHDQNVLATLSFPALTQALGFRIYSMDVLATLNAPLLRTVDSLEIQRNPLLSECAAWRIVAALTSHPSIFVQQNDTTTACVLADTCRVTHVTGITPAVWSCFEPVNFADARTKCATASTGAGLLWLESDAEWTALLAAVGVDEVTTGWIGYSDVTTEGTWVNFAGSSYDPTTRTDWWSPSEPNGSTSENGAELTSSGVNDLVDTNLRNFLCRVP
ncbi:MAG: C-type lectin domain-containing protein [Archangium sp.]